MTRRRSSKVFIRVGDNVCDFMRLFIGPDGTVMVSFSETGKEEIYAVFDEQLGELRKGDFAEGDPITNPKISFHASGIVKLASKIGLNEGSVDRVTVVGEPLSNIDACSRLMEILIPPKLRVTNLQASDRDIILDASSMLGYPLRCSVFRMSKCDFLETTKSGKRIVDTSQFEFVHAFEVGPLVLGFVLRVSFQDKMPNPHLVFFLPGRIKWGNQNEI